MQTYLSVTNYLGAPTKSASLSRKEATFANTEHVFHLNLCSMEESQ